MAGRRLLFASYHCYVDPSSGAAISARDLLELLAARGWDCRVFCGPRLDVERPEPLAQLIGDQQAPVDERRVPDDAEFSVLHFTLGGVPCSIYNPTRDGEKRTATSTPPAASC